MTRNAPAPIAGGPHTHEGHHHVHSGACNHDHAHHRHAPTPFLSDALISARGLQFSRGGRAILEHIDLDISKGEIVTLIGPNGAGKTTLVRLILGIATPDGGEIRKRPNLRIGYVPQRFDRDRAIPLTVERFLTLGAPPGAERIEAALAEVGASGVRQRQVYDLSGGELQRVVLARAILRDPDLLVLDEPVRGVDYTGEAELYTLIGQLRTRRGLGVLLVSHDLHIVMGQSDRVVCVNRHVCCSGVPESVARDPEYARLFGAHAASAFALYSHHHDHRHDLAGEPHPAAGSARPGEGAGA
jgi:zinc transport system ATP-binding protein